MKTCAGCEWYQTEPYVTGTNICTTSHMCYRDSGTPEQRSLTLSEAEPPLACKDRWAE